MWKYEFSQFEVQRVVGPMWDLGSVRVHAEADACCDSSLDFLEQLLLRHMNLETGELQSDLKTRDAIENARDNQKGFATLFNYFGHVFKVETNPAQRRTDVSVAEDDVFSCQRLPLSFQALLQDREEAAADAEQGNAMADWHL